MDTAGVLPGFTSLSPAVLTYTAELSLASGENHLASVQHI